MSKGSSIRDSRIANIGEGFAYFHWRCALYPDCPKLTFFYKWVSGQRTRFL